MGNGDTQEAQWPGRGEKAVRVVDFGAHFWPPLHGIGIPGCVFWTQFWCPEASFLPRRKCDVTVLLCEIWSTRGCARCDFWATFRPRFGTRGEALHGLAMRNSASRRCPATSFLRRRKSDVTVLLCEICHTRGWGSKTRAAVALVDQREVTKNRGYDY